VAPQAPVRGDQVADRGSGGPVGNRPPIQIAAEEHQSPNLIGPKGRGLNRRRAATRGSQKVNGVDAKGIDNGLWVTDFGCQVEASIRAIAHPNARPVVCEPLCGSRRDVRPASTVVNGRLVDNWVAERGSRPLGQRQANALSRGRSHDGRCTIELDLDHLSNFMVNEVRLL
jgi:hypothetical protein